MTQKRHYVMVLGGTFESADAFIGSMGWERWLAVWSDDPDFPRLFAERHGPPSRTVRLVAPAV